MVTDIVLVLAIGAFSGVLGASLGIGGGVFLVPLLSVGLGMPFKAAAGISLITVIATSSVVSANVVGRQLINLRLGMLLEVATAAGGLAGGLTAQMLSERTLERLFGAVAAVVAILLLARLERRNIRDVSIDPGRFGGRFFDEDSGREVVYRVKRLPIGLGFSFLAGNISSLLGIGGGIIRVPVLNVWCGIPVRIAAATSAMMMGVTAVTAAPIYYANGDIIPHVAAAAVLGVVIGSPAGFWVAGRIRVKWLKLTLGAMLLLMALFMLGRTR
jgi:uncharacterized membrane protein YfcA